MGVTREALQAALERRGYVVRTEGPLGNATLLEIQRGTESIHRLTLDEIAVDLPVFLEGELRALTNGQHHVWCLSCHEPLLRAINVVGVDADSLLAMFASIEETPIAKALRATGDFSIVGPFFGALMSAEAERQERSSPLFAELENMADVLARVGTMAGQCGTDPETIIMSEQAYLALQKDSWSAAQIQRWHQAQRRRQRTRRQNRAQARRSQRGRA